MLQKVEYFMVIGDSLSDKGQMANSYLNLLSGLSGTSPDDRFTNGYIWLDFFCNDIYLRNNLSKLITTDENKITTDRTQIYLRSFAIGGLSAANYKNEYDIHTILKKNNISLFNFEENLSQIKEILKQVPANNIEEELTNIKVAGSRLFLSNLEEQRKKIKENDKELGITPAQKADTLVIEWSGANDMITVNASPEVKNAKRAILARIENLEEMIAMGYQKFILFNLPNLEFTPRFQKSTPQLQTDARIAIEVFNSLLAEKITEIQKKYPQCTFQLFDVNAIFTDAIQNPTNYGLNADKKYSPLIESPNYQATHDPDAAKGYIFWDDVHPTEAVHNVLGDFLRRFFDKYFYFELPEDTLLQQFKEAYGTYLASTADSWCGLFRQCIKPKFNYLNPNLTMQDIFLQAKKDKNGKIVAVLKQLGWIDQNKKCQVHHSSVIDAIEQVNATLDAERPATGFSLNPIAT